ncbi:anti-sigma factor family protein [Gimesia sp.]|uniref:anti-sigma factor family protein n=1 Tax=Gimesia sp. TaxID=2024833 RepID=UPI003A9599EA
MNKELNDQELEKLVAYLDGEVTEQEAIEVEQSLSTDEQTRAHVDGLERTWELLDKLPITKASQEFTDKTLSTIKTVQLEALAAEEQKRSGFLSRKSKRQLRRAAIATGWTLGLACSVMIGYLLTNQWVPAESDPLLEEFSFIENLDTYSEVQNLEFLEALKKSGTFDEIAQQPKR